MITITILAALVAGYLLITNELFGTPISISNTHYLYSERYNHGYIVFPTFMALLSFLLLPYWLEIAEPHLRFAAFLACGGLLFVGVACCYKEHLTKAVHYTSASVWAVGTLTWLIAEGIVVPICIGAFFGVMGVLCEEKKKAMYFAEVACVIALLLGLVIKTTAR